MIAKMKCCSRFTDMESVPEKHCLTKKAKQRDVKLLQEFGNVFLICLEISVYRDYTVRTL